MDSNSGNNSCAQEGVNSDSKNTNKTKQQDNRGSQSLEGPLQLDGPGDDEKILVDHDHNQLLRRRSSQETKKENKSNSSNRRKLDTNNSTGASNNELERDSLPKMSWNNPNYNVPDKDNTNNHQSEQPHQSFLSIIEPTCAQSFGIRPKTIETTRLGATKTEGPISGNHFFKSWVDGEVTYGAAT